MNDEIEFLEAEEPKYCAAVDRGDNDAVKNEDVSSSETRICASPLVVGKAEKETKAGALHTGCVYEIRCLTTGKRYIGSTTRKLYDRIMEHIGDYDRIKKHIRTCYRSCSAREVIKGGNIEICVLAGFKNISVKELRKYEDAFIRSCDCVNLRRAQITDEERSASSKKHTLAYYYRNHETIQRKRAEKRRQDTKIEMCPL